MQPGMSQLLQGERPHGFPEVPAKGMRVSAVPPAQPGTARTEPRPRGTTNPAPQRPRSAAANTAPYANHPPPWPMESWTPVQRTRLESAQLVFSFSQSTAGSRDSPRPRWTRAAASSSASSFRHAARAALCVAGAGAAGPPPPRSRPAPANGARCFGGGERRRAQLGPPPAGRGGTGTAAAPARPQPRAAPARPSPTALAPPPPFGAPGREAGPTAGSGAAAASKPGRAAGLRARRLRSWRVWAQPGGAWRCGGPRGRGRRRRGGRSAEAAERR